jgi:hypothetical protein
METIKRSFGMGQLKARNGHDSQYSSLTMERYWSAVSPECLSGSKGTKNRFMGSSKGIRRFQKGFECTKKCFQSAEGLVATSSRLHKRRTSVVLELSYF